MSQEILIIDESSATRREIMGLLSQIDPSLKVFEARDGNEGLNKIGNQQFALIISDIQMPRLDIRTFLAECKKFNKEFRPKRLLLLSTLIDKAKDSSTVGNITYMARPYAPAKLQECLRTLLAGDVPPPPVSSAQPKFDVEFINPFIVATLKVLKITAGVDAVKEYITTRDKKDMSGDISAILSLSSSKLTGSLAICFEQACYLKIMGSMLGEQYETISDDNKDGVGELCNQIFGMAKMHLNKNGHDLVPAIPTIVAGLNHKVSHFVSGTVIAVGFKTEFGDFTIEAAISGV